MKQKAIKTFLTGIFAFAVLLILSRLQLVIQAGGHNWAVGEWFINYNGGFVRRGLPGQILLTLPFSNKAILILLFAALFSIVIFIYISILKLTFKSGINFVSAYLLLNPAGLLFIAWDQNVFIRKEWIGYGVIVLLIFNTFKWKSLTTDFIIIFLFVLSLLSSEINAVFIPSIIYLFSHSQRLQNEIIKDSLIKIFSAASLMAIAPSLIFHGDAKISFSVCEKVKNSGFDPSLNCDGAIQTLGYTIIQAVEHLKSDFPEYFLYFPLAIFGISPILLTNWFKSHIKFSFSVIISALPLFLIAWDYGRWISIVVTQLTIFILMENNLAKRRECLPTVVLPNAFKILLLLFCLCFGFGHGGNPLSNGWIGFAPSLVRILNTLTS